MLPLRAHLAPYAGLALVGLSLVASPAAGQEFRGSIAGAVVDSSGGILPGVTVTVTNVDTGVSQHVITNDRGLYDVPYLNPGTYSVTAELQGFKKFIRPNTA